jgi:transcriptional regulator with XRE-family HTH domain
MKTAKAPPFASRVAEAMRRRGLSLRSFCRQARLDASFFSKVLAGKRSPPSEESVLRRVAQVLDLDAAELIVSAGRIPSEWGLLWRDPELFRGVHALATGAAAAAAKPAKLDGRLAPREAASPPPAKAELSEELL